jgi:hypothetical protein
MNIGFGAVMFELTRRSILHLHDLMVGGSAAALLCDSFRHTSALPLARELSVRGYVFLPNSFVMVSLMHDVKHTRLVLFFFFNPLLHF